MKLLVLFFVLSVRLCYAIDGYAQSTYFTLELNNKTVKEVFKAIEKNSEYVVFYYDGVVDVNRKVTIQAENKTVDQILDELFAGTSNIYEIKDRQIVISKKILPQEQHPQIKRITGKEVDEKGLVMPGEAIQDEGTLLGVIGDVDGSFAIAALRSKRLTCSFIGMQTPTFAIVTRHDLLIQIQLQVSR